MTCTESSLSTLLQFLVTERDLTMVPEYTEKTYLPWILDHIDEGSESEEEIGSIRTAIYLLALSHQPQRFLENVWEVMRWVEGVLAPAVERVVGEGRVRRKWGEWVMGVREGVRGVEWGV